MRILLQSNMIGSLLFYALYPLSRYLTSRTSDASTKDHPPAGANGTAVWDVGAVTPKKFTQSKSLPLDPLCRSCCGTKRETKERMIEPRLGKEDNMWPQTDNAQLMTAVQEKTKNEAALKMGEVQLVVKEKEKLTSDGLHKCKVEGDKQEDGHLFPADGLNSGQEANPQLECLHKNDQSSEKDTTDITECWDEYIDYTADEMHGGGSSKLMPTPLVSSTQNYLNLSTDHDTQTSWHFPAGPGLAEEVQCPLWEFPAMSYYPPSTLTEPLEVLWRVWEENDESISAEEPPQIPPCPFTKPSMDFRVMSYNVLADDLLEANQDLYIHCPLEALDWSYRCNLILEEILKWAPDILCLQEVQENHYYEQLHPALSQMGYKCVYKRRTGNKTDGCATCYRCSVFSEVSVTPLEFFRPETELLDRHNVGIVLLLRPVVTMGSNMKVIGPSICIANTHLLFNPRRGDVKLAQLAILLAEIDQVVQSCKVEGEHCNVILCGDFNSVPHMPLYQLITTGELYFHGLPAWKISGQEDLSYKFHCHRLFAPLWHSSLGIGDNCQYTTIKETYKNHCQKPGKYQYSPEFLLQLRFSPATCVRPLDLELIPGVTDNTPAASRETCDRSFRNTIRHRLNLESVYKHILPGSGSPEVTTLHSEVGATVDYIFYTPRSILSTPQKAGGDYLGEGLKLIGSLSLLSGDVLWSLSGLPNDIFPSDHLSLVADFQMDLNVA